ncbi:hypothetical protein K501DRAFT_337834 [Backusella circina FSU 941]|nr:hypothetical protein K501DRAFT_337834 [Backusella circina FSU 941]
MDYDFNSSDILFPGADSDIETSKLTSPMCNKGPEGFDWVGHDFANTFNDKAAHYLENFITFNQRIKTKNPPLEDGCFGPLHTAETSYDEEILLFTDNFTLYQIEKQKMINGALDMIQNDMRNNPNLYLLQNQQQEEQSWHDEMYQDYNGIGSIGSFSDIKPKLSKYPNESIPTISQRNDVISPKDQPLDKHADIDYPTQSINRRQASKVSKIASYFKTRLAVFFS